jgi:hypothetical protein
MSNEMKYVCLLGDFNSRTGHLDDFFTSDNYLSHVRQYADSFHHDVETRSLIFKKLQIPLKRSVKDSVVNNFGYKLVEFCKNNELYVANSRVRSDKIVGNTTCRSSSTIDYVLASVYFFELFQDFDILEFCNFFSDVHNPVSFSLHSCPRETKDNNTGVNQPRVKLWCTEKAVVS